MAVATRLNVRTAADPSTTILHDDNSDHSAFLEICGREIFACVLVVCLRVKTIADRSSALVWVEKFEYTGE